MKSPRTQTAIDDIRELIGEEIGETHLYLESIVTSNARLRLAISKVDNRVEVNRVPASYLWGHFTAVTAVATCAAIAFGQAQEGAPANLFGLISVSTVIACGGYGFIKWVNMKAAREDPILNYDLKKRLLIAGPRRKRIERDDILCIIALASIPHRANKPMTRSELKVVFRANSSSGTDSVVIARNTKPHLPVYDDEITPFARGLKVPYLHVKRDIARKDFEVIRIV